MLENIHNIIDCHLHLYDGKIADDINNIIIEAKKNNVKYVVNNSDSLESLKEVIKLQNDFPSFCYSALGIHPEYATNEKSYLDESFKYIYEHKNDILAIGEIGLDYHYSKEEEVFKKQKELFIKQLSIARELDLPVVIHARDSLNDVYKILKDEKIKKFYLHCYSGSYEQFKEFKKISDNFKIGVGGVITFKNSRVLKEIVSEIDLKYILTETDSPYLAPVPFRGQNNKPSYLKYVIEEIANIKQMDISEASNILFENGVNYYGIK